jgi:hypothetical protein
MSFYKLSKDAVLEIFDEGGLVLILPDRRLVELNSTAVEIIKWLDGRRTWEEAAAEIAKNHLTGHDIIIQDVLELCLELVQTGVLELQPDSQESGDMTSDMATRFLCNPDVVLREEDPDDGALLFNPDTNQVKVINTTGLFIWQQCGVARTMEEIVAEVQKDFAEVPSDQVAQDVREFVDGMLATGFIGTVEPDSP